MAASRQEIKVGLFVAVAILLAAYATIQVTNLSLLPGGTYSIYLTLNSAQGINIKTPVEIAGVQIGEVEAVELINSSQAKLKLNIQKGVELSDQTVAVVRTRGFLGDTYIELLQPIVTGKPIVGGGSLARVKQVKDFNDVTSQIGEVTEDIKEISASVRALVSGKDSPLARTLDHIEVLTERLARVTANNENNINVIIDNFRALSQDLRATVATSGPNIDTTTDHLASVMQKIDEGEGTVGQLINDDKTIKKVNESLDKIDNLLGGLDQLQLQLGYHGEYLGETEDFKHYVSLKLKPRPDKFFLLEFVDDPAPDSIRNTTIQRISTGGATSTVTTETESTGRDKFLFTAQLGKQWYDVTLRGGLIESSGGLGVDYNKGPVTLSTSVFDFETKNGERPHLKSWATLNVTPSIYLLGGLDDYISRQQDPDWFVGAGINMIDNDFKSLLGIFAASPKGGI